jgi:hypothetical protein
MRRTGAEKQDWLRDAPLHTPETMRRLRYGRAMHLGGVIFAMRMMHVNPALGVQNGAAAFLGQWLVRAKPEDLRLVAAFVEGTGLMNDCDPVAARLVEYGCGACEKGETPRQALARFPIDYLVKAMTSRGIDTDQTTIRKTLNRLGVQRSPGRRPKPRL